MNDYDKFLESCAWFSDLGHRSHPNFYCPTRDVFEGRLSKVALFSQRHAIIPENESYLLTAVLGEIGNNSFDHNVGHWANIPGIHFGYLFQDKRVVAWIFDRGRGIQSSLTAAHGSLGTSQETLDIAFQRIISGRFPEQRGNGLKFVRQVVNGDLNRGLWCRSQDAEIFFGKLGSDAKVLGKSARNSVGNFGTASILLWGPN